MIVAYMCDSALTAKKPKNRIKVKTAETDSEELSQQENKDGGVFIKKLYYCKYHSWFVCHYVNTYISISDFVSLYGDEWDDNGSHERIQAQMMIDKDRNQQYYIINHSMR